MVQTKIEKQRPTTYTKGNLKVVEWTNTNELLKKEFKNYVLERFYKDAESGEWKTSTSFSYNDLVAFIPLLAEAIAQIKPVKVENRE